LFSPHFFFLTGSFSSSFPLLFLANAFSNHSVFKVLSPASCILRAGTMMFAICAKDWFVLGCKASKLH
jgi:hypothetical protein